MGWINAAGSGGVMSEREAAEDKEREERLSMLKKEMSRLKRASSHPMTEGQSAISPLLGYEGGEIIEVVFGPDGTVYPYQTKRGQKRGGKKDGDKKRKKGLGSL